MTSDADAPARVTSSVAESVACAVALIGVVDAWLGLWFAPVFWAAAMIVGTLVLLAVRARSSVSVRADRGVWATPHAAVGLLLLAMLHVTSIPSGEGPSPASVGHDHGSALAVGVLPAIASIGAIGYSVLTVLVLPRIWGWRARVPVLAMPAIVLLLAGSVVG